MCGLLAGAENRQASTRQSDAHRSPARESRTARAALISLQDQCQPRGLPRSELAAGPTGVRPLCQIAVYAVRHIRHGLGASLEAGLHVRRRQLASYGQSNSSDDVRWRSGGVIPRLWSKRQTSVDGSLYSGSQSSAWPRVGEQVPVGQCLTRARALRTADSMRRGVRSCSAMSAVMALLPAVPVANRPNAGWVRSFWCTWALEPS
jgi:hypothetical protein